MTDQEKRQIQQKNLIWSIAVESTIQSREDPFLVYERLLKKYNLARDAKEMIAGTGE